VLDPDLGTALDRRRQTHERRFSPSRARTHPRRQRRDAGALSAGTIRRGVDRERRRERPLRDVVVSVRRGCPSHGAPVAGAVAARHRALRSCTMAGSRTTRRAPLRR
jgi:hypothetical protein